MSHDTLLLVASEAGRTTIAFETHARRLRDRNVCDEVQVLRYEHEPRRELGDELRQLDTDRAFVLPLSVAHSHETLEAIPGLFDAIDAPVQYCEPLGRSPLVTEALVDRAAAEVPDGPESSVALVAFGSGGKPHQRQVTEYHADRIRERTAFGEVEACYLLQNPAVECVRYNLSRDHAVAVPLFFADCEATETAIPSKLELDRGGLAYADTLGGHPLIAEAIAAAVETERTLAETDSPRTFEETIAATARPMATDGDGE